MSAYKHLKNVLFGNVSINNFISWIFPKPNLIPNGIPLELLIIDNLLHLCFLLSKLLNPVVFTYPYLLSIVVLSIYASSLFIYNLYFFKNLLYAFLNTP